MASSKKKLPGLPIAFPKSRQELEHLDKFDDYIRAAQSKDKATVTKNINLAARTATRDLLSHQALKHVVDSIKCIAKDGHSHKETAIFLVDSILVHAAHYCEEASQVRFLNHFAPLVANLFKRAMSAKHGRFRDALAQKLLQKILPKWKEHGWFSEDACERMQEMCLRKAPADVKRRFDDMIKVQKNEAFDEDDVENEEAKLKAVEAMNYIKIVAERKKVGAIQPATPARPVPMTPGGLGGTPMTPDPMPGGITPMLGGMTPMVTQIPRHILGSIPRTPAMTNAVPMTPKANNSILSAIPQTPMAAGSVPQTPRLSQGPSTPNANMVPGTPNMPGFAVPGTPNMPGFQSPGTPQAGMAGRIPATPFGAMPQGHVFAPGGVGAPMTPAAAFIPGVPGAFTPGMPMTPAGARPVGQPFTPAGAGRQPFTPGMPAHMPSTPANAMPRGQPFTPGMPTHMPSTPANAMPRGQPFTPGMPAAQPFTPGAAPQTPWNAVPQGQPFTPRPSIAQPFTPAAPQAGAMTVPRTPANAMPRGAPFTPAGQPFSPAGAGGGQPFTPAGPSAVPMTPAAALGRAQAGQPFTPAGAGQPFTPAVAGQPFTPAGAQPYTPQAGGLPNMPLEGHTPDGAGEQTPAAPPEDGGDTPVPITLSREEVPTEEMLDLPTPRLPAGMETPMQDLYGAETPIVRVPELPPAKRPRL